MGMEHPEADPEVNNLIQYVHSVDTCDIWCLGCESWQKMNASYAKYLNGEIESCGSCRKG